MSNSNKSKARQIIVVLCLIMVMVNLGLAQSPATNPKQTVKPVTKAIDTKNTKDTKDTKDITELVPEAKTVDWYYERALVYYLREQNGRATIELYKALEKDTDNPNVNYLLGILFKERQLWKEASEAFFRVTQTTKIEHLPARLELAGVSVELGSYQVAFLQLEKVIDLMKLDKSFRNRLYQYQVDASTEKDITNVKKQLKIDVKSSVKGFIAELSSILSDSPEFYSKATIDLGLDEPLVYNELVELYDGDEEENYDKALDVLKGFLAKRNGFSPVLLAQIGAVYQKQNRNAEAIAIYEKVVKQLTSLGFSEAAGDFSTEEIQNLQAESKKQPLLPQKLALLRGQLTIK